MDVSPAPSERLFAAPPEIPLAAGPQLLQGVCVTQHRHARVHLRRYAGGNSHESQLGNGCR